MYIAKWYRITIPMMLLILWYVIMNSMCIAFGVYGQTSLMIDLLRKKTGQSKYDKGI